MKILHMVSILVAVFAIGACSNSENSTTGTAGLPIGSVVMWSSPTVPSGWLLCDGKVYNIKDYPALSSVVGSSFGNIPKSGNFDPATQFFVPDLRGRFIRGVDDAGDRDPDAKTRVDMQGGQVIGPQVGSVQSDMFTSHTHEYSKFPGVEDKKIPIASGDYWIPANAETGAAGGNETRPINAYLYFIIKAE